ncbi:unnamed protein product [Mesocestoides corti]|uniref:FAR1 domain-containing protein n=1 Tax=Mesocestoides corti TaxID=53468 RepID=A0A0R3U5J7_MESCO|nr:unnamed protein product [Mesocestoides corti]
MEGQLDCSEDFMKYLGSTRFSTYEAFNSSLEAFQKAAYFTVGSRNSQLGVVKYYMVHNHEAYPEVESVGVVPELCTADDDNNASVDCTAAFLETFKEKLFGSFAELQAKMDEFQRITGSLYGKRNTKRFPPESPYSTTLVYKSFTYECYHYGTHNGDSTMQRVRRSAKIGCRSRIHVSCYRNKLKIVRFDVKHNHDVAPERAKSYPRNRRLTQSQLAVVEGMFQTNQDSHAIKDFIENTFNTTCTMSDVRNIKARLKASVQSAVESIDEDDGLPNLPSFSSSRGATLDGMITQLTPHLEHIQDLLLSSPNREAFDSRIRCLSRLIEIWQEGKEAMVLVPQRHVIMNVGHERSLPGVPRLHLVRMPPPKPSPNRDDVCYRQSSPENFLS